MVIQIVTLAEMEQAERRRSTAFEALVLLAAPTAIEAAKAVNQVVWKIEIAARAGKDDPTRFVSRARMLHDPNATLGTLSVPNVALGTSSARRPR